jgi:ankyrin repeat protein
MTPKGIERVVMKLLEERHPRTACPSEVARTIDPDAWRAQMQPVREAVIRLARRSCVEVTQRGAKVDPATARGAIRLRLAIAATTTSRGKTAEDLAAMMGWPRVVDLLRRAEPVQ